MAFVIAPGAVSPLPLYELALMTASEVYSMGIDDAQLTVITPEAVPLVLFAALPRLRSARSLTGSRSVWKRRPSLASELAAHD